MAVWQELHKGKDADLDRVVRAVLDADQVPQEMVDGITSSDEDFRFGCFLALVALVSERPELVYPAWDRFADLLDSPNAYHRSAAVRILARLAPADRENKLDALFERLFEHLDDDKILVTRYLVQDAGVIAGAKPALQERVVDRLLSIDDLHHKHKDLIKGDAIEAMAVFFDDYPDQDRLLAFVTGLLESESPKTRKVAKAFLQDRDVAI